MRFEHLQQSVYIIINSTRLILLLKVHDFYFVF